MHDLDGRSFGAPLLVDIIPAFTLPSSRNAPCMRCVSDHFCFDTSITAVSYVFYLLRGTFGATGNIRGQLKPTAGLANYH
jgi:hypothetical protein